jgi:hypothetical protein
VIHLRPGALPLDPAGAVGPKPHFICSEIGIDREQVWPRSANDGGGTPLGVQGAKPPAFPYPNSTLAALAAALVNVPSTIANRTVNAPDASATNETPADRASNGDSAVSKNITLMIRR